MSRVGNFGRWIAVAILIFAYQNCSPGFKLSDAAANLSSTSSTPGPAAARTVDMVILYGDSDTTTISCDGGATWAYHNFNADHLSDGDGAYSSTSMVYDDGYFYLMKGWGGAPAVVTRSRDGINWTPVTQLNGFYSGLIVQDSMMIIADGGTYQRSTDSGQSFTQLAYTAGTRHLHSYVYENNGPKMLMVGDGSISTSADGGATWSLSYSPPMGQNSCAESVVFGPGALVTVGDNGDVCRSTDDGATWTHETTLSGFFGNHHLIWTGSKFIAYPGNQNIAYQSADGITWTQATVTNIYPVNQSVFFYNADQQTYYAYGHANTFYSSADGFAWNLLDPSGQPPTQGGNEFMELFARGPATILPGHPCYK